MVVGSSLLAAKQIASGATKRAVSIAGGLHHAMRDRAAGFCVYNDTAVAISWLLDNGFDRIAYLDTDVHHGDGVQDAFYDDPRVLTISMHQNPLTLFPGTGFADETGGRRRRRARRSTSRCRPTPTTVPGSGPSTPSFPRCCRRSGRSCSSASAASTPTTRTRSPSLSLSVDGHRQIYRTVRELAEQYAGGNWLACGGGGYQLLRVVPRSWTHLIATMLDREVDPATTLPREWTDFVDTIAPGAELPTAMTDEQEHRLRPVGRHRRRQVDSTIRDTRRASSRLHGLDPDDPRD